MNSEAWKLTDLYIFPKCMANFYLYRYICKWISSKKNCGRISNWNFWRISNWNCWRFSNCWRISNRNYWWISNSNCWRISNANCSWLSRTAANIDIDFSPLNAPHLGKYVYVPKSWVKTGTAPANLERVISNQIGQLSSTRTRKSGREVQQLLAWSAGQKTGATGIEQ